MQDIEKIFTANEEVHFQDVDPRVAIDDMIIPAVPTVAHHGDKEMAGASWEGVSKEGKELLTLMTLIRSPK